MTSLLFTGATLPDGSTADIAVDGGIIVDIGSLTVSAEKTIDVAGLQALPGLVDLHTHMREPGFEASETVLTGSRAAARGGFTTLFAMANTQPVADNAAVVELIASRGREAGYAFVQPIGAVTRGLAGDELADIGGMVASRAHVRVFSDDGKCVHDSRVMRRALEYVAGFDGVIAQHAQDPYLTAHAQMNEGDVATRLGLSGWPAVAEETIIARDVLLAQDTGAHLHVCHLSTAGSVEVIRWAKQRGIRVTAEVTPHHLLLTDERAVDYDARFKVNPPLRTREDVEAVRAGLADGTIDIVATDHAPHPSESKTCEWDVASFGMVGLESAVSVVQESLVNTGLLTWNDVARVLSEAPSRIGRLDWQGIAVGAPAHLTFVDTAASRQFGLGDLAGTSQNSPYVGQTLPGNVLYTVFSGVITLSNGEVVAQEEVITEHRRNGRG